MLLGSVAFYSEAQLQRSRVVRHNNHCYLQSHVRTIWLFKSIKRSWDALFVFCLGFAYRDVSSLLFATIGVK